MMPATTAETAASFLEHLHAHTDGWLTLFAVDRSTGNKHVKWAKDAAALSADADRLSPSCCVWYGVATRREHLGVRRGGSADCLHIPGMWVDIDVAGDNHQSPNLPPTMGDAGQLLADYPHPPTVIIDTGGGLQALWLFAEPLTVDDATPLLERWAINWKELGRRHQWHVDNVFDASRVLRLPGTWNTKTNRPQYVGILDADWSRVYQPGDLEEACVDPPAELREAPKPKRQQPYIGPERPGDAYNLNPNPTPEQLLTDHGMHDAKRTPNGDVHLWAPHRKHTETSGATIYGDDGHTTIYSETFAAAHGLEPMRPYDPFGLYVALEHNGDWAEGTRALRDAGYGSDFDNDLGTLIAPPTPGAPDKPMDDDQPHDIARDGAAFILDESADLEARWGHGGEVLWARGESLVIAAPPGVGKTTLAGQILAGLLGVLPEVLGYPVQPANRVLYLAMDRPRQIRRSLRRLFGEQHRQALTERLVVRPGPMPSDLGKKPELLVELASRYGCDSIIVDSLKDAAVKLTDDEIGGNVNRAIQYCNAADIDVLVLHHQRKGTNGDKPTKLEDLYGSTWISAGAGSVILLWGEAGSEIVEMSHLKQPADPVGPFTIEHDHHGGRSTISRGFDALAYLRQQGSAGSSVAQAAQAEHGSVCASGSAKWKKTERRLRALVRDGYATTPGRAKVGDLTRYYAVEPVDMSDLVHGHAHGHGGLSTAMDTSMDTPPPTMDTEQETPGQTMDTPMDTPSAVTPWTHAGGSITPAGSSDPPQIDLFAPFTANEEDTF